MKELLVKDYRILLTQKKNMILILAIGILMVFTTSSMDFIVGYLMMLILIMSAGTINYDEVENGMAFLMTLPASRKIYAVEKYVLVFMNTFCTGVFLLALYFATKGFMKWELDIPNMIIFLSGWVVGIMVAAAFILPLYLKFGVEKRRVVMLTFWGAAMLLFFGGKYFVTKFIYSEVKIPSVIENTIQIVENANKSLLALIAFTVSVFIIALSVFISVKIMKKKEF